MPSKRALAFWLAVAAQVAVLVAVPLPKVVTLRTGCTVFLQVAPVDPYNVLSGYYVALSYDASLPGAYFPSAKVSPEETTQALVRQYMSLMSFSPTSATLEQLGLTLEDLEREYPRVHLHDRPDTGSLVRVNHLVDRDGRLTTAAVEQIHAEAQRSLMRKPPKTPFRDGDIVYAVLESAGDGKPWRPVRLVGELPRDLAPSQAALRARFFPWQLRFGLEEFYIPEVERGDLERALTENRRDALAEVRVDKSGHSALVALHVGGRVWRAR
ncbi:MAG: GDYXXLXY domain-containing protein [Candidatus Sumerlaeaceae bacterium]|nr:GDYXXLXY domain-containing protein [Candidatus Sumerlaeaceae bacterium]